MSAILKIYRSILIKFPICSQAVQTGLLMGSGDLIAQTLLEKRSLLKVDLERTARFSFIGTCFVGPPLRIWYGFMDKRIGNKGKMATLKKVAFDQLLFAPPFLAIIMALVDLAKGSTLNETQERLRHDYPDVLKTNYKFWPAIQLCNFYIIPLQYQVLTVQLVAIFWNTYLSWKMNQAISIISVVPPSLTQTFKARTNVLQVPNASLSWAPSVLVNDAITSLTKDKQSATYNQQTSLNACVEKGHLCGANM